MRRTKATAASVESVGEKDASNSESGVRVTDDTKLPAELFLAIMKLLADEKNLKTLLELTLGNKALAAFGRPILKSYPRRNVWLALQFTAIEDEGSAVQVLGAYCKKAQAQAKLEAVNDFYDNFEEQYQKLDWYAKPFVIDFDKGIERFYIEKHFVVGRLDKGHVWLRMLNISVPGMGDMNGNTTVEEVYSSEKEARAVVEDDEEDIDNDDYFDAQSMTEVKERSYKRIKLEGGR